MLKLLAVLLFVGAFIHYWSNGGSDEVTSYAHGPGKFMRAVMPTGATSDRVWVLTPENCPSEDARRANRLVEDLEQSGIPVVISSQGSFQPTGVSAEDHTNFENTVAVLNGPIPAVFVNGMGKANPSAEEVIDAFHGTE